MLFNGTVNTGTLAERLVDFCKDFDFYNYMDSLEVGQTLEDAIGQMETELRSPEAVSSLLTQLKDLSVDEDLTPDQRREVICLIKELTDMSQRSPVKPSLHDQIRAAEARTADPCNTLDPKAKLPEH